LNLTPKREGRYIKKFCEFTNFHLGRRNEPGGPC
jgi:hypothetical protein